MMNDATAAVGDFFTWQKDDTTPTPGVEGESPGWFGSSSRQLNDVEGQTNE